MLSRQNAESVRFMPIRYSRAAARCRCCRCYAAPHDDAPCCCHTRVSLIDFAAADAFDALYTELMLLLLLTRYTPMPPQMPTRA